MSSTTAVKYAQWNKLYLGGAWRSGSSSRTVTVRNPYNQEVLAELPLASVDDIDLAYRKAQAAQHAWAEASAFARAEVMERAAAILAQRKDEMVHYLVEETGSSYLKASIEVDASIGDIKLAAEYAHKMTAVILPSAIPGKENRVYRAPVGVVGAITPWNWPFYLSIRVVAPALATGNAIVLKADSQTPITGGLLVADLFEQAGLPPGLLSVVVADLDEVGDAPWSNIRFPA